MDEACIVRSSYRPFASRHTYYSKDLNEDLYQLSQIVRGRNPVICLSGYPSQKPFQILATDALWHHDFLDKTNGLPLRRFSALGSEDNITDWALKQFRDHYGATGKQAQPITKDAIFHYVYAVLHDPVYREKYAQNLKREFPRIPLYGDGVATFWQWAQWGERLMAMHVGYEDIEPWPLTRTDIEDDRARKAGQSPKPALKADKAGGRIVLDSETTLAGIPPEAWDYRLGNRSALEWILDQYKESKPRDPIIREKFDTYRFADHKEHVIDLLQRVTRVSVETQAIVEAMRAASR